MCVSACVCITCIYAAYIYSSDLCFEHNICAKLISTDTQQTVKDIKLDQRHSTQPIVQSTAKTDATVPRKSESHVQERFLKPPKKPGDYHHFVYESIVPATLQSDDAGKRPSIKHSPSLSKIEEEEDGAEDISASSGEADTTVPLKPPVKFTSLQEFSSQRIIKSPKLAAIEEESVKSSSPESTSCSPTAVNCSVMQSLMDQKIEHASRDDDRDAVPVEVDDNSDLGSVSLDPAIWSDSDAEEITNIEESPQPSQLQAKVEEKIVTPAVKAIGSVRLCLCVCLLVYSMCACVEKLLAISVS